MGWALVFFVLFLVAVAVAVYFGNKRHEIWQMWARQYGLRYRHGDPYRIAERHDFALFREGHSKKVTDCLEGTYRNLKLLIFDYQYKSGSGKHEHTHYVSGILVRLPILCPYLIIRPESFLDRFGSFFGFEDINFEYETFNRAFNVKGDDKKFAYDICHSDMMDFLLGHRPLTLEIHGRELLLYSWRMGSFDPGELAACLEAATGFVARIPDYLRQEPSR